ncbi:MULTISPECIES: hypothetical protein [unclassified Emergencia]|uniref:hypothetical protein n=1 Tax=unclassified Emergencia TaxID=2642996 RepID=UPI00137B5914|nr:hypothetical protein [Emergencia sp. 1XD21-10]NCE99362.1 hypothetical protein [Emergencia sp. 1XD21-10]
MAEVRIAIAKTPSQADKLGRTITKSITLSEEEARVFRDYYYAEGQKVEIAFGAVVSIMTAALPGPSGALGIGVRSVARALDITTSTAAGVFKSVLFKSYYSQLASKFDMTTSDKPTKCTMTYQYNRVSSNDGYYWLKDIDVN